MRFSPYLQSISMSFANKNYTYAEMALGWSEPGLESVVGSYVEYQYPGTSTSLPLPLNPIKPFLRFVSLPVAVTAKGSFSVSFSNGAVLGNTYVDIFFLPWLSRFNIVYKPYWNSDYNQQALVAVLSWEIDPLLINRVSKYTLSSQEFGSQDVSIYDNTYAITGIAPSENVPMTLTAYAYDETVIGQIAFTLYAPDLQLIPTQSQQSNLGYNKSMDPSGVSETYNVNHNKTIGQLTTPTQAHAPETRSLGTNLPSMNPATVVSGDANNYVQSFDANNYNKPFDYSDAVAGANSVAPNATATLTQTHQGNYTLNHGGTLNKTTTVNSNTQTITAPQINNTIENYNGTFSGDTFSETSINKYIQIENEQFQCNEQSITAPQYTENTNNLQQIITGDCNIQASSVNYSGTVWTHNGQLNINGPCDLGGGGGGVAPTFVQPVRTPNYATIPPASDDYYIFLATMYGESAGVPHAWEAVADSIVLRAAKYSQTPGGVVKQPGQYDAYTNPSILLGTVDRIKYAGNWQFLKAYAYLIKQKLNGSLPMTSGESQTLASMDSKVRPIYVLYTNKSVLLAPVVSPTSPDQSDTCPEQYKQNNPANPLKYYITNYYSPQGQGNAPVGFLVNVPTNIDPNDYQVIVPGVTSMQFKFYNIPHKYY